jgi:uncharacterized protein
MGPGPDMTIRVVELPCERSFDLPVSFVRSAIEGLPLRAALQAPADDPHAGEAKTELSAYGEGDNVFVRGSLRGWLEVACSRCVGPAKLAVDEELFVTFMPAAAMPRPSEPGADADADAEVGDDDLELYPYDGEVIDLQQLLRDQLILSVPFAPLCDEGCLGLCSVCGANLNEGDCGCEREVLDPRLQALKNIKL